MARARAADRGASASPVGSGGAAHAAPPLADPLRLVRVAVAGGDLAQVTRQTGEACGRAVALTLPGRGASVLWPPDGAHPELLKGLDDHAQARMAGDSATLPDGVIDAVAVELGHEIIGVAAAMGPGPAEIDVRPWLEAAAAAAAITLLVSDAGVIDAAASRASLLEGLELQAPADVAGLLSHARRLGSELNHGAVGLCAFIGPAGMPPSLPPGVLVAEVGAGRLLGLVPLDSEGDEALSEVVLAGLRGDGAIAACSGPRRSPELLQEALMEAALLAEVIAALGEAGIDSLDPAQQETHRLLIGVLLRTPEELARLRLATIAELERYDAIHDTELLATLGAFLSHHGSTTETAEAMGLHRHTVGYRLARVQEVSGLSPYESDGRERLSLGLKADRILAAESRRSGRARR